MNKLSNGHPANQAGFTLIELVIVIIVIGILAAVAIPKLTNVSDAAHKGVNEAIVGMVKSAWVASYAINKGTAVLDGTSTASIEKQTSEPLCTYVSGTQINCPTPWNSTSSTGVGGLVIDIPSLTTSAGIACHTPDDCQ